MPYLLNDVYIGEFPITQPFGARPDIYSARYGLKGHNGIDIGCPSLTLILAAADGVVQEMGFDQNGFGNYIKLRHPGYLTLYGHLNDIVVKKDDKVIAGQLIAHSNNTGYSDGPHLHFGVAPCDVNGAKTQADNGFSGYIDPMDTQHCQWHITNPKQPVSPQAEVSPQVSISHQEFSIKTIQANNFLAIVNYAQTNGLGVYLSNHGQSIDLINNPADVDGAMKVNEWVGDLLAQAEAVKQSAPIVDASTVSQLPADQKAGLLQSILSQVKGFIFK